MNPSLCLQGKGIQVVMEKRTTAPTKHPIPMFCNNCGEKGHVFKACTQPVLSCGIVLINQPKLPVDITTAEILMIRRKDSMSYAEFMRGKYDPEDHCYVGCLFVNMTLQEQTAICCEPFDTLWRQLWGDDYSSPEYVQSKERFHQVNRDVMMRVYLSTFKEPEWGFPKGRRVRCETDLECAIREFNEETNVPREAYTILNGIRLEETFLGLNAIQYKHVYFVAMLTSPGLVNVHQKMTFMQRREISAIGWKTFRECRGYIRPHHIEREGMLDLLENIAKTYESTL
jgi:8-oxo-dGTP pyrophosphatase MutT (NUDIX family)